NTEQMGSSLGASFFKETLMSLYLAFLFMGLVVFLYFGNNLKYKLIASTLTGLAAIFLLFTSSTPLHIIAYLIGVASLIIYLMNSIPSIAVIGAALSDIIVTLAVVNIMGMKLSTAGIAAFLMLIGYSVDTDILLTTRLVKRKVGTVLERLLGAMKTGLTMSATTIAVVSLALIFSQSDTIRQIMTILLIGLIVDLINTWIQNVGILRIYLAKKTKSS
ncbi:MAG: hypothetical protein KAH32_08850, partial [Chlamydiia bacterium]|nr:hypothetical protein [Chlamydiia bacterium]